MSCAVDNKASQFPVEYIYILGCEGVVGANNSNRVHFILTKLYYTN